MDSKEILSPLQILHQRFGFNKFRHQQKDIIDNVLQGQDTFVLMPTGGGKSLCYQIPALIFKGTTIVISPLIALMKDQVDALKIAGISAAFINSSLSQAEQLQILQKLQNNQIKILYLAPEKLFLQSNPFIDHLKKLSVSLFAIDEAHCISQWGHDFRPEYLSLSKLKQNFPKVPVIALTATADEVTRKDILQKLNLTQPRTFISSFNRPNIHYYIEPKSNSFTRLTEFLKDYKEESGIIYVLSRNSTEKVAEMLEQEGYSVKPYHAGLDKEVRDKHQEMFIKDQVKIIVATIAFGMGIDKSNVRFVVHLDLPKNIEGYYQETGRAGRDGLESKALLFYSYADAIKMKNFAEVENNPQQSAIMLKKLDKMVEFCKARSCRRKFLLNYFGEESAAFCGSCDVCLTKFERFDGTKIAQMALSAVARLKESFGVNYIVDFLRGSTASTIKEPHKHIKTYGVGAEISKADWMLYIRNLIEDGFLTIEGKYPVLKLTGRSRKVLFENEKVLLIKNKTTEAAAPQQDLPYENDLLIELKKIRYNIATSENLPAYIIFSDATLMELATFLPQNLENLKKISGMGEVKIARYGHLFLQPILKYCQEKSLKSRIEKRPAKKVRKGKKLPTNRTDTKAESFNMFKKGMTIQEIGDLRDLSVQTVVSHLSHYILSKELKVEDLVSKSKIPGIIEAINNHGDQALSPIKMELGDGFSYGEIKAVINHLKVNQHH